MLISRPPVIAAAAALVCGLAVAPPTQAMAAPSTLMISGYLEGSGNNKAIELYNPTDAPIALSDYSLRMFANGATTPTNTWTGAAGVQLAPGEHFLIVHGQAVAALKDKGDIAHAVTNLNGDDALQLLTGSTVVDSFGQTGVDPGDAWIGADVTTKDSTLLRNG